MNQSKEPSAQSFLRRDIVRDFWRLAPPIVLVQMSTHLAGFVDTVLIGRVGEVELGASGIGNSIFLFASIFGMGAAMGLDPVAAQHFGAGEPRRARSAYWQGVYLSCFMSVPLMLLCWALTTNLTMFGVVAELAVETEAYVLGRLPSLVAVVLLMTMRSYLQAARYTRAIVWGAIWANVFNFVADWILIYGDAGLVELGLPAIGVEPMGTFGVGAASSVAAFIQVMVFLVGITDVPIGDGDGEISVRAL